MRSGYCRALSGVVAVLALVLAAQPVRAQSRAETLRYVTGASVNTLDPNVPGSTRESFAVSLSTYDRLVSFGRKQLNGKWVFDLDKINGELAESYDVSPDKLKITFHLRKDAKFQDGTPVTAEDVKWSLDRAVTAPILGKAQLLTGSMTSADQFKVIDPATFEVTLPKPDKLALPNLATVYPIIINSKVAKANAATVNIRAKSLRAYRSTKAAITTTPTNIGSTFTINRIVRAASVNSGD